MRGQRWRKAPKALLDRTEHAHEENPVAASPRQVQKGALRVTVDAGLDDYEGQSVARKNLRCGREGPALRHNTDFPEAAPHRHHDVLTCRGVQRQRADAAHAIREGLQRGHPQTKPRGQPRSEMATNTDSLFYRTSAEETSMVAQ